MRKFVLLAALLAILVVAALPALAADRKDRNNNNRGGGGGDSVLTQDNNQEADSGEVNQAFNVAGGGDNSNQCVGLQGVANTGNAQNQTNLLQYASTIDEFSLDESGSTIEVSPTNTTECDQQVNQAASASGGK
jgi:hypothetical protein